MANKFFNSMQEKRGAKPHKVDTRDPAAAAPFTEKPGPAGGLPGKSQSRDRSGGVRKIKQHTKSEGL